MGLSDAGHHPRQSVQKQGEDDQKLGPTITIGLQEETSRQTLGNPLGALKEGLGGLRRQANATCQARCDGRCCQSQEKERGPDWNPMDFTGYSNYQGISGE